MLFILITRTLKKPFKQWLILGSAIFFSIKCLGENGASHIPVTVGLILAFRHFLSLVGYDLKKNPQKTKNLLNCMHANTETFSLGGFC